MTEQTIVTRLDHWAAFGWTEMQTGAVSADLREAAEHIEKLEETVAALQARVENTAPYIKMALAAAMSAKAT